MGKGRISSVEMLLKVERSSRNGEGQDLLVGFVEVGFQLGGMGLNDRSVLYGQIIHIGQIALPQYRKHVCIVHMPADDHRFCLVFFQMFDLLAGHLGAFKVKTNRVLLHFPPEMLDNRGEVALHDVFHLVQALPVFFTCLFSLAGPLAIAEMIFETNPEFPFTDIVLRQIEFAGAQLDGRP